MINTFIVSLLLRQLLILVLFIGVLLPVRVAVMRFLPHGRMKRLLLRPVGGREIRADDFARRRQ